MAHPKVDDSKSGGKPSKNKNKRRGRGRRKRRRRRKKIDRGR